MAIDKETKDDIRRAAENGIRDRLRDTFGYIAGRASNGTLVIETNSGQTLYIVVGVSEYPE